MRDTNRREKIEDYSTFWGSIAPYDHIVQVYESDESFLEKLAGFVISGLHKGDSCILIATVSHLEALDSLLADNGYDTDLLRIENKLIALEAEEVMKKFMVNGWPSDSLFSKTVSQLLQQAKMGGKRVRAFGEMVAILWKNGYNGAAVQLEHLWSRLCEKENFCLFCAYPGSGFTGNKVAAVGHICSVHSKVVTDSEIVPSRYYNKLNGE